MQVQELPEPAHPAALEGRKEGPHAEIAGRARGLLQW